MKIHVLMENTSSRADLATEHGLSLYLEAGGKRILFDAGQSDAFMQNARLMDVDLAKTDLVILSHGHYDHSGGMAAFLTSYPNLPFYAQQKAFGCHYSGQDRYIGVDAALATHPNIRYPGDTCTIAPGLTLLSLNGLHANHSLSNAHMTVRQNDQYVPDLFEHEQYLLVEENGKRILISGCSHKGVLNLMEWLKPDVLIGGFHWMDLTPEKDAAQLTAMAQALARFHTVYYTCHCTYKENYEFVRPLFDGRLHYLACGDVLTL